MGYVAGCGLGHFVCSGFGYFIQKFLFCWVLEVIQVMPLTKIKKPAFPMLKTRLRESVKTKMLEVIEDY